MSAVQRKTHIDLYAALRASPIGMPILTTYEDEVTLRLTFEQAKMLTDVLSAAYPDGEEW